MKAFVVAVVAQPYFKVRRLSASLWKVAEDLPVAEVFRLGESCCRPQSNEMADTGGDFYGCGVHKSKNEIVDSARKVEALQFLNDPGDVKLGELLTRTQPHDLGFGRVQSETTGSQPGLDIG